MTTMQMVPIIIAFWLFGIAIMATCLSLAGQLTRKNFLGFSLIILALFAFIGFISR